MSYRCNNCEATALKWSGVCGNCGQWGTLEELSEQASSGKPNPFLVGSSTTDAQVVSLAEIGKFDLPNREPGASNSEKEVFDATRFLTGNGEVDRVLGGGMVKGSVVVIGGKPGIGKSTLISQLSLTIAKDMKILYVAGEESPRQLYSRFERLSTALNGSVGLNYSNIDVTTQTSVESVAGLTEGKKYDLVIVDSIQSMYSGLATGLPGGVSQVKACGAYLVSIAKKTNVAMFIVGQVNKDGAIAGPRVLEHVVDAVLYLDGDENGVYRVLSSVKNRFGATDEIGVFEMVSTGLVEVANPSLVFVDGIEHSAGSVVTAISRGSRVVLVEVQALVVERGGSGGPVRRVANGIKSQRLEMLCAVMGKFAKLHLFDKDVFVNVVGGMSVDDRSIDLAICVAIKSSLVDKAVGKDYAYIGEVGLTGGVRPFYGLKRVVKELKRLGYKNIVSPIVDGVKTSTVVNVAGI